MMSVTIGTPVVLNWIKSPLVVAPGLSLALGTGLELSSCDIAVPAALEMNTPSPVKLLCPVPPWLTLKPVPSDSVT